MYYLLYFFSVLFPFLIYPWEANHYYALTKAYYLIGFTLLVWLSWWFLKRQAKISIGSQPVQSVDQILLVFLFLIGCSTLFHKNISLVGSSTEFYGILIMFSYSTLFYISSSNITLSHRVKITDAILLSSIFVAIYGILQHFHLDFLTRDSTQMAWDRSFAFFDNPDYFGSYLVLVILLAISSFFNSKRMKEKYYFVIICLHFTALLYSSTRSAWLGASIGFIVLTLGVVWKRRDMWLKWGVLTVSLFTLFLLLNTSVQNQYTNRAATIVEDVNRVAANHDTGFAGSSRWYIWKSSLPLLKNYFWLGSGPNTFGEVYHPGNEEDRKKYLGDAKIFDENNDYLQIALTLGVPALAVYLLFVYQVLKRGFHTVYRLHEQDHIYTYGLLAAIIGYLVQAFFNISVVTFAPYFWILLGLSYDRRSTIFMEIHEKWSNG